MESYTYLFLFVLQLVFTVVVLLTLLHDCLLYTSYYHLNLPKKDGSRGLRVKSICDGVLESITSSSHIKLEDLKGCLLYTSSRTYCQSDRETATDHKEPGPFLSPLRPLGAGAPVSYTHLSYSILSGSSLPAPG